MFVFFFFKQKTAYELRISDWSSDVCSSDLSRRQQASKPETDLQRAAPLDQPDRIVGGTRGGPGQLHAGHGMDQHAAPDPTQRPLEVHRVCVHILFPGRENVDPITRNRLDMRVPRSEEHTSELQSLMRISYAVFCLTKKKTKHNI